MTYESIDRFCGSPFWDTNLTWHTEDPDLTDCFQRTVLVWVPCVFLWTFSALETYYLLSSKTRNVPWNWLNATKLVITLILVVLTVADLGNAFHLISLNEDVHPVDIFVPIIKIMTFCLAGALLFYNRKRGMRTSGLLFLFWLLLAICGAVQYRAQIALTYENTGNNDAGVSVESVEVSYENAWAARTLSIWSHISVTENQVVDYSSVKNR